MKLKRIFLFIIPLLILILGACSSNSENSLEGGTAENKAESDMATEESEMSFSDTNTDVEGEKSSPNTTNRLVIYHADLSLEVKNFQSAIEQIEKKVNEYGGYVIESNTYRDGDEFLNGMVTVRVPQEHFQSFLNDAEGIAVKVYNRTVNGEDVTEEYVDLESRLKSKRVVEERLLEFMKNAEKTEDLLKISNDLANLQEEMEQILGRIKYLENQSSLSTITISLSEDKIIVPNIDNQELNTWERTKSQFFSSLNFLLSLVSGLFVLVVGNLPFIIILFSLTFMVLFFVKKARKKGEHGENDK